MTQDRLTLTADLADQRNDIAQRACGDCAGFILNIKDKLPKSEPATAAEQGIGSIGRG